MALTELLARLLARLQPPATVNQELAAPFIVPGQRQPFTVKFAASRPEWEAALALVARTYKTRGYVAPATASLRFTPYHALPDTVTALAYRGEEIVATMSLVFDNTLLGLPVDKVYPDQVTELRSQGYRLGEITSLADEHLELRDFLRVFTALVRLLSQYFFDQQAGHIVIIAVNPRHEGFYRRMLGFLPLGLGGVSEDVGGAPAQALWITPQLLQEHTPRIYQEVFGEPLPTEVLTPGQLPRHLIREFSRLSERESQVQEVLNYLDRYGPVRCW